ncbi:ParB N-terminal domain-containing protein, partial [Asaia siamensis]
MNVQEIAIELIDMGDRLRSIDTDYVSFLAASIEEHGLRQPIELRKIGRSGKYALISGGHRLNAAISLGHEAIMACVVVANDLQAQLLEIDENLFRRELSPLDRATFLARRKEVYETLHPETKHGGDRKSSDRMDKLGHLIPSFSEVTAEKLGVSERTVRRAVLLFQGIAPDVRHQIAHTWLADSGSQLDALAKLTPDLQRKVLAAIPQLPDIRQVGEIMRQIEGKPKPE